MSAHERVHAVDRRNTRLDKIARVDTRIGIDRVSVYIDELRRYDGRVSVDRFTEPVENAAEQSFTDAQFERRIEEFVSRRIEVESGRIAENLNDRRVFGKIHDAPDALVSVSVPHAHRFEVKNIFGSADNDDRTVDRRHSAIFYSFHTLPVLR